MNNTKRIIIALVVIGVVVAGAVWYKMATSTSSDSTPATTSTPSQEQKSPSPPTAQNETAAATITYTNNGFEVSTNKVPVGSAVKVINNSDAELDFSSDDHPTHKDNSEFNQGDIAPGGSKTFTLNTPGTWGFHNHYNAQHEGSITVE